MVVQHIPGEVKVEGVARELRDRDEALRQLKLHLTRAQEQMKRTTNAHRRDISFEIGDWVYLKLRPQRQQLIVHCLHHKLASTVLWPISS